MGLVSTIGGRNALPVPPHEIADEVELYARESGRTATLHFVPADVLHPRRGGTWMARFSLRANDKRMLLWQQGRAPEPPTEDVWFHRGPTRDEVKKGFPRHDFIPLDILEMGASGVRGFLERGNTWSGRGKYTSLVEQLRKVREERAEEKRRNYATAKEENRHERRDERRQRLGIPFLPVGISFKDEAADEGGPTTAPATDQQDAAAR